MSTKRQRSLSKAINLSDYIGNYRSLTFYIVLLSGIINLLALTGAFYMLQIYDRALTSGSVPTLVAL